VFTQKPEWCSAWGRRDLLTRRGFLAAALALAGAVVVTSLAELAQAVASGTRAAMRRGMFVLEPQKGRWINQNLWGDQRAQPLPAVEGQVVAVLGKNTIMYGPPAVHSVQLARGDETPASNADVRARVTYGCGGTTNTFDCDWLHGAQFALVCNSVSVAAVSYAPSSLVAYQPADGAIFLSASVCKGSTQQGRCPLSYTEAMGQLPGPGALSFPIARDFTREVVVHLPNNDDPAVPTGVFIEFTNSGGFVVRYDAQVCAGGRAIPVPGGAFLLTLSTAGVATQVVVQWLLGL